MSEVSHRVRKLAQELAASAPAPPPIEALYLRAAGRSRQRKAIAASACAGAAALTVLTLISLPRHPHQGASTLTERSASSGVIPWRSEPSTMAACRLAPETLNASWGANALGRSAGYDMIGSLRVHNLTTVECLLPPPPKVAILDRVGVPLPVRQGRFSAVTGTPTQTVPGGGVANLSLEWRTSWCGRDPGPTPPLRVTFQGRAPFVVHTRNDYPSAPTRPSCVPGTYPSELDVSVFTRPPTSLASSMPTDVQVALSDVPTTVTPGQVIKYNITLTSGRELRIKTCPSYEEQLAAHIERYVLNCAGVRVLRAGTPTKLAMQFTVPLGLQPGTYALGWSIRDWSVQAKAPVTVG